MKRRTSISMVKFSHSLLEYQGFFGLDLFEAKNFFCDSIMLGTAVEKTMIIKAYVRQIQAYFVGKASAQQLNILGWFCYWVVFNLYCFIWREYAAPEVYSLLDSNLWFLKEWAVWVPLCAGLIYYLDKTHSSLRLLPKLAFSCVVSLCIAISIRALFNSGEYPSNLGAVAVIMAPKYASALGIFLACWLLLRRRVGGESAQAASMKGTPLEPEMTVQVEQRGLISSLPAIDIVTLKAAGNYVEIATESDLFLKRITLAQLLRELPEHTFMRVHRSYAINTRKLYGLINTDNGAAIATLTNQQKVPVSKRYKPDVKRAQASMPAR